MINVLSLFHNSNRIIKMKTQKVMNVVISDSARGKMTDSLYSKVMDRVKKGVSTKTILGFKVSKIGSSIILL